MEIYRKSMRINNNKICFGVFTISCLIAMLTCAICGLAITNGLSWSLIAIASIIFGWLVLSPMVAFLRKGFYISSTILSLLIIPFLYLLSILLDIKEVFSVGWVMSVIGVIYLWCVIGICCKFKQRPYLAAGFSVLLAAPVCLLVNLILSKMFTQSTIDARENILSAILLLVISAILFLVQYIKSSKTHSKRQNNLGER